MTNFKIESLKFIESEVTTLSARGGLFTNWPMVYTLNNENDVYVGESLNIASRMRQHLKSSNKTSLRKMHLVVDDTFNKSACLDLESFLIKLFAGEGRYRVLNGNGGVSDAEYYSRAAYRASFQKVFDQLRAEGLFHRLIPEIENSDLFKFSPFKALNHDQAAAVEEILDGILDDAAHGTSTTSVVQGDPGTGKTIIAVFIMKLLKDIQMSEGTENLDSDSRFSDYFVAGNRELIENYKIGLVIPQQSLRATIRKVFSKTPSLMPSMVLSPFDILNSGAPYDLLIVDEAHRLSQRANQPSGPQNKKFREITENLFGIDDLAITQLDWIKAISKHQVLLIDVEQSVRPADLPEPVVKALLRDSESAKRNYRLRSQMRVNGGVDYINYVRGMLSETPPIPAVFGDYDFRFYDTLADMHRAIIERNSENGLSRLVAGFAWPWITKYKPDQHDIVVDGYELRWNQTQADWINSPSSLNEVGSIHTVQGYDLNYAGVIIGPDLRYDPISCSIIVDRANYYDKKGKENNPKLGLVYTDQHLLRYIKNIYAVLLTRGISGTYVYVHDKALREYLRQFFLGATRD